MTEDQEREQLRVQRVKLWAALVSLVVVLLVLVALQYGIANAKAAEAKREAQHALLVSEQKWCLVIRGVTESYRNHPPTTAAGQELQTAFDQLLIDFGC